MITEGKADRLKLLGARVDLMSFIGSGLAAR